MVMAVNLIYMEEKVLDTEILWVPGDLIQEEIHTLVAVMEESIVVMIVMMTKDIVPGEQVEQEPERMRPLLQVLEHMEQ